MKSLSCLEIDRPQRLPDGTAYWKKGSGTRILVCLHGVMASKHSFEALAPFLAHAFTVYALDLQGHGDSTCGGDAHLEAQVAHLGRVLRELRIDRCVLLGHSHGASIALGFAAVHPEKLEHLVLVNASDAFFDTTLNIEGAQKRPVRGFFIRLMRRDWGARLLAVSMGRLPVLGMLRYVYYDFSRITEKTVQGYVRPLKRADFWRTFSLYFRPDREAFLAEGRRRIAGLVAAGLPVSVLWGEGDRSMPPRLARLFASRIPGARLFFLPKTRHIPQEERPGEFSRLLLSLL